MTLTDHCSAATLTLTAEALENTAFGQTSRTFTAGLFNNELTLTLFQGYGATEVETMLNSMFGVASTIVISPAGATESASNPEYTLTGCYLETVTPISATVGELSVVEATFMGGTYARDVTTP
tara:strand:- start:4389 stop:4757 length:369 start_codon:yes stop_codon:yes gene_type:complete